MKILGAKNVDTGCLESKYLVLGMRMWIQGTEDIDIWGYFGWGD